MIAGIAGARRNAAVAICCGGRTLAACEQERLVRSRAVGIRSGGFPEQALDAALDVAGLARDDIVAFAAAEDGIACDAPADTLAVDHHLAHAASAAYAAPFDDAVVLVCDRHSTREVSFWLAQKGTIAPIGAPWEGPGFARVYSRLAAALGFVPGREEHKLEALARIGGATGVDRARALVGYAGDVLEVDPCFEDRVSTWLSNGTVTDPLRRSAEVASSVQQHLGEALVRVLQERQKETAASNLCLAGGLFYNAHLNSLIAKSGLFQEMYIPPHPGNPGLALGAALQASQRNGARAPVIHRASPYLGPEFNANETKAVLDNCKLTYEYAQGDRLLSRVVDALRRGHLVGWFQGRMEWGPRALGNRSILASPTAPYVLDNLNVYLKHREPHRGYGLSICEEDLDRYFNGPASSPYMQYEYRVQDPDLFRALLPCGATSLRVHTVGESPALLRELLKSVGCETGLPVLVNTSFNGFNEPIVCSPRDAVRVFYGTGLNMLVIGNFILTK